MRNHQSIIKILGAWPILALLILFQISSAFGQLPPEVAQFGYPETIFLNGKVVSMDDASRSTEVGKIYQAVAVKEDKLKMWTSWASEYVLKEDQLGTLEVGKFADLIILDRDYFTVPVDDLLKIRVPMTMVGGKIIQLQASLASEFGVTSIGPVYDFSDEEVAAQFLGGN